MRRASMATSCSRHDSWQWPEVRDVNASNGYTTRGRRAAARRRLRVMTRGRRGARREVPRDLVAGRVRTYSGSRRASSSRRALPARADRHRRQRRQDGRQAAPGHRHGVPREETNCGRNYEGLFCCPTVLPPMREALHRLRGVEGGCHMYSCRRSRQLVVHYHTRIRNRATGVLSDCAYAADGTLYAASNLFDAERLSHRWLARAERGQDRRRRGARHRVPRDPRGSRATYLPEDGDTGAARA